MTDKKQLRPTRESPIKTTVWSKIYAQLQKGHMQPRPEEDESTDVFMYLLLVKLVGSVAFV